jgi:hypothetical protein
MHAHVEARCTCTGARFRHSNVVFCSAAVQTPNCFKPNLRTCRADGVLAELEAAFDRKDRAAGAAKEREGLAAALVRCAAKAVRRSDNSYFSLFTVAVCACGWTCLCTVLCGQVTKHVKRQPAVLGCDVLPYL